MNPYKCKNCGVPIDHKNGLCNDCKAAATELDNRVRRKTDEEVMEELEKKPRSFWDVLREIRR